MTSIVKKKFNIEDMDCVSCAMNIDFELEDLEGVKSVKTNYAKQTCEVEYDERRVKLEDIIRAIEKLGYKAILDYP